MEIEVLKQTKDHLRINIEGEDHTLCNAIRSELWQDKNLEAAGYVIEHPLVSSPILTIDAKTDPKKVLLNSIAGLKKKSAELATKIKKL